MKPRVYPRDLEYLHQAYKRGLMAENEVRKVVMDYNIRNHGSYTLAFEAPKDDIVADERGYIGVVPGGESRFSVRQSHISEGTVSNHHIEIPNIDRVKEAVERERRERKDRELRMRQKQRERDNAYVEWRSKQRVRLAAKRERRARRRKRIARVTMLGTLLAMQPIIVDYLLNWF